MWMQHRVMKTGEQGGGDIRAAEVEQRELSAEEHEARLQERQVEIEQRELTADRGAKAAGGAGGGRRPTGTDRR
jgi:hypothetical protein